MSEITKTRKQEALALLALDTMTRGQEIDLNVLTAKQAGYTARETGMMYQPGWSEAYLTYRLVSPTGKDLEGAHSLESVWLMESPEFCNSVDACLTLMLPENTMWTLRTGYGYATEAHLWSTIEHDEAGRFKELAYAIADVDMLPLAMLKAWWSIQDEQ